MKYKISKLLNKLQIWKICMRSFINKIRNESIINFNCLLSLNLGSKSVFFFTFSVSKLSTYNRRFDRHTLSKLSDEFIIKNYLIVQKAESACMKTCHLHDRDRSTRNLISESSESTSYKYNDRLNIIFIVTYIEAFLGFLTLYRLYLGRHDYFEFYINRCFGFITVDSSKSMFM